MASEIRSLDVQRERAMLLLRRVPEICGFFPNDTGFKQMLGATPETRPRVDVQSNQKPLESSKSRSEARAGEKKYETW